MVRISLAAEHPAFMTIDDAFAPDIHSGAKAAGLLLKKEGFHLIGELCFSSEAQLKRIPNLAVARLAAINAVLAHYHLPAVGVRSAHDVNVPFKNAQSARAFLLENLPRPLSPEDQVLVDARKIKKPARRVLDPVTRTVEAAEKAFKRTPGLTPAQISDFRMLVTALTVSQLRAAGIDPDAPKPKG